MSRYFWTAEEIATLLRLKEEGLSNQEIGARLGVTELAAKKKLSKIKHAPPKPSDTFWTHERVSALRLSVENGLTARDIAALIGCTRSSVLGKKKRLKLRVQSTRTPRKRLDLHKVRDLGSGRAALDLLNLDEFEHNPAVEMDKEISRLDYEYFKSQNSKAKSVNAYLSEPSATPPPEGGVPIWELGAHHCRAVLNDTMDTEALRYCGGQTVKSGPWCKTHHARYCTPVPGRLKVVGRYR
jgi:hypothetical protein